MPNVARITRAGQYIKAIRLEHKACTMDESGTGEGFPTAGFIFVGSYPFTNNPPAKPAT